ncbi:hypothetical protein REPUB_Repub07fG0197300 [Reevesia pubescens]
MGKRGGGTKKAANTPFKFQNPISLREEASGKKQTKGGSTNVKAVLKHEHLQNLAIWASGEASIPSLASFFGHRLAADGEASAIPPDPSFFPCQRCETILQSGFNWTVRIEKNQAKARHRHKKPHILTQNSVVYNCHICSHRNLKRVTPKGHMKVPSHVLMHILHGADAVPLSPLGEACLRMDLTAIHELSFQMWTNQMQETLTSKKKGDVAFRHKDFRAAIECYTPPTVYARRSLSYLMSDMPQEAVNDALQAQFVSPIWHIASYLQAAALFALGKEDEAQAALKEGSTLENKKNATS